MWPKWREESGLTRRAGSQVEFRKEIWVYEWDSAHGEPRWPKRLMEQGKLYSEDPVKPEALMGIVDEVGTFGRVLDCHG